VRLQISALYAFRPPCERLWIEWHDLRDEDVAGKTELLLACPLPLALCSVYTSLPAAAIVPAAHRSLPRRVTRSQWLPTLMAAPTTGLSWRESPCVTQCRRPSMIALLT
jgi:hypothetical protein